MGFIRLVLILLVALTIIYAMVSLYSRSVRREKLENAWDAAPESDAEGARDTYIAKGLADYRTSLRRKLILLVYVVPVIAVSILVYVTNSS
jgi:Ca2+/Na+ antiporter